jgi:hypothetical protein
MTCKYPHCPGGEYGTVCESECRPNRKPATGKGFSGLRPPRKKGISLDWVLFVIAVGLIYLMLIFPMGLE